MTIAEGYTTRLEAEVQRMAEPLTLQLADIDAEIEQMAFDLTELRAHRTKLIGILRHVNPAAVPQTPKQRTSAVKNAPSEEKIAAIKDWLWARGDEMNSNGGVTTTKLLGHPAFDFPNKTSVSKALKLLHERGFLVLDRVGRGNVHYYKVVR